MNEYKYEPETTKQVPLCRGLALTLTLTQIQNPEIEQHDMNAIRPRPSTSISSYCLLQDVRSIISSLRGLRYCLAGTEREMLEEALQAL